MMGKEKDNTQKMKKYFIIILILFCVTIGIRFGWKLYNRYIVPEDMSPLVYLNKSENAIMLYYLQSKEFVTIPAEIVDVYVSNEFTLNGEKREEVLLVIPKTGIIKYNYTTKEIQQIGNYQELGHYSGHIEELRFVPDSNNISFVIEDKIMLYNSKEQCYQTVYDYSDITSRFGYPYKWKNEEEIYLLYDKDIILYNIETKQMKTVIEDVGDVYFQMSDDNRYIVFQNQKRENQRDVYVVDMDSGKQWQIHTTEADYKVDAFFSTDSKFIFLKDRPRDSYSGKIYCYLYDINKHKKYRFDANTEKQMYQYRLVGW